MPLYEYECQQCHRHTEKRQKFSDPEITDCPHCGGKLERVITAPAIAFKGGGWYADGYGNAKPKSTGESPAAATSEGAAAATPAASPSEGTKSAASSETSTAAPASAPAPAPAAPAKS